LIELGKISCSISDALEEALKRIAEEDGTTLSRVLEVICRDHLRVKAMLEKIREEKEGERTIGRQLSRS